MRKETPEQLPDSVKIACYACEKLPATHVCRFKVGELSIQVCLCTECMKMDTASLLKNTVGIQGVTDQLASNYIIEREVVIWPRPA